MTQGELRVEQFTGIDANQLAILLLKVRDLRVRQSFEARSEAAFGPARSPRHSAELTPIACKEADDQVGFPNG